MWTIKWDTSRLKQELTRANQEITVSHDVQRRQIEAERETMLRNELLSNDLLMATSRSMRQESELTTLQRTHQDRSNMFHSEIATLQSVIQNQNQLHLHQTGFRGGNQTIYSLSLSWGVDPRGVDLDHFHHLNHFIFYIILNHFLLL